MKYVREPNVVRSRGGLAIITSEAKASLYTLLSGTTEVVPSRLDVLVPAVLGEVGLVAFPFGDVGADFAEAAELGVKLIRHHALVLGIEVTDDEAVRQLNGVDGLGVVELDANLGE